MSAHRATAAEKKRAKRNLARTRVDVRRATDAMLSAVAKHVESAVALANAVQARQRWQGGVLRRGLRLIRWAGENASAAVRKGDHAAAEEAKDMLLVFSDKMTEFVNGMSPSPQKLKKGTADPRPVQYRLKGRSKGRSNPPRKDKP